MSIFSLLIAIRRRDDGLEKGFYSIFGWGFMFTSRILVFALVSTVKWGVIALLLLCSVHVIWFTCQIYQIAIVSHKNKKTQDINVQPTDETTVNHGASTSAETSPD